MSEKQDCFDDVALKLSKVVLDSTGDDCFFALKALGAMGERAMSAIPNLISSLQLPGYVQYKCFALGLIGPKAISAEDALVKIIHQSKKFGDLEEYALQALGRIQSKQAIPTGLQAIKFSAASKTQNPGLDSIVYEVFRHLGQHGASAMPDLVSMLNGKEPPNKLPVISALHGLGIHAKPALRPLRKLYKSSKRRRVRLALSNAIDEISA